VPPLTWDVDNGPRSTLVTVQGTVDTASTAGFGAMLDRHTARPPAVLVDISAIAASDPDASAVVRTTTACGIASRGPAMLVRGTTADLLVPGTKRIGRRAPLITSLGAVTAALLTAEPEHPIVTERLRSVTGAVRRGRDVTTEACLRWDVPDLIGPATLVTSELLNFAIDDAARGMDLAVGLRGGVLSVGVRRASPAGSGRPVVGDGMSLVNVVAAYWGLLRADGDTVMCAGLLT
jgi:hypothetical protein